MFLQGSLFEKVIYLAIFGLFIWLLWFLGSFMNSLGSCFPLTFGLEILNVRLILCFNLLISRNSRCIFDQSLFHWFLFNSWVQISIQIILLIDDFLHVLCNFSFQLFFTIPNFYLEFHYDSLLKFNDSTDFSQENDAALEILHRFHVLDCLRK